MEQAAIPEGEAIPASEVTPPLAKMVLPAIESALSVAKCGRTGTKTAAEVPMTKAALPPAQAAVLAAGSATPSPNTTRHQRHCQHDHLREAVRGEVEAGEAEV